MKKILPLLVIAMVFSCRKDEPHDAFEYMSFEKASCYNGTLDSDEEFTDCGGSCKPCEFVTPPCSNTKNKITLSSTTLGTKTYTITEANITKSTTPQGNPQYVIILGNDTRLTIVYSKNLKNNQTPGSTALPENTYYNVPSSNQKKFFVEYIDGSYVSSTYAGGSSGGEGYFNQLSNEMKIDFCTTQLKNSYGFNSYYYTLSGNLTLKY